MSELLGAAYKLRNAANRTTRSLAAQLNADVALLCEYALNAADTMEAEHASLRDELRELQELCNDLSSTVIAAAFLAPHGNGAKALLDEVIERMTQRARRKVSDGEASK